MTYKSDKEDAIADGNIIVMTKAIQDFDLPDNVRLAAIEALGAYSSKYEAAARTLQNVIKNIRPEVKIITGPSARAKYSDVLQVAALKALSR
jgi:uncharacterized protein (UPF0147 family)